MEKVFDLHLHSNLSDGKHSPEEVVFMAKQAGMKVIALTDHDNIDGVMRAVWAGERLGMKVIPGVEFSSDFEGENHILGLFINYKSKALKEFFDDLHESKERQITQIVKKLHDDGFDITMEDVLAQKKGSMNRAHIAEAIKVKSKQNEIILKKLGVASSTDIFNLLLKPGSPYFMERERPPADGVVNFIQWLDGMAVWAHPNWRDNEAGIERKANFFKKAGLDALEVVYNVHYQTPEQALHLHNLARSLDLTETAGSDFHSLESPTFNKVADFSRDDLELNLPICIRKLL